MGQPHSYTREDVIEFQCHGGPVVTRAVLQAVLRAGARLAEPGEFTKRAFLNGRLDLAEAEAVMALVRSRTEASRRAAVEALGGRLSGQVRRLQERLTRAIAQVEAGVDFPDEEIDASPYGSLRGECQAIDEDLARLVGSAHAGKILRQGLKVVIAGRPNVGKSSLLNALLREDRAIVTAVPGTTRDAIEEPLDLSGVPVRLVDTAGLRATTDPVESLGVERTRQWLTAADVILAVVDVSEPLRDEDRRLLESLGAVPAIVVLNKSDLLSVDGGLSPELEREVAGLALGRERVLVSAATGAGLDRLEQALIAFVYAGSAEAPEEALVGSVRNEESLRRARSAVGEAVTTLARGLAEDLAVVDLREAWSALGEITGETVDEGILDRLFAEFCVGK
jgi:tRNA modification GTPase